jgi:HAE1 family hydrophobic/amphiphilic exporter-1
VIGGLVFSQIVTLFILPVIYLYFEDFQEKILDKIPFFARYVGEAGRDGSGEIPSKPAVEAKKKRKKMENG